MAVVCVGGGNDGKVGYIDKSGELVVPFIYGWASCFSEGLGAVNIGRDAALYFPFGGKWGYIDKTGQVVVPFVYDYAGKFINGFAMVGIGLELYKDKLGPIPGGGKWGFIDKTGKEILPFIYEWVDYFKGFQNGYAEVRLNNKRGYIDKQGNFYDKLPTK
jgi:hypothetical protein